MVGQACKAHKMEKGNKMGNVTTRITTDKQVPGYWRVTLNHPPINLGHLVLPLVS